jgi:DNA adenine methylase
VIDASLFRLKTVSRLKSPLGYPGGKTKLAPAIIAHLPAGRFKTFVEPFFGSGAVTFALPEGRADRFVANDLDPQLMGFWKNLRLQGCRPLERCVDRNTATLENRRKFTQAYRAGTSDVCPYFMARRVSFNSNGKDVNLSSPIKHVGKQAVRNCAGVQARLQKTSLLSKDFRKVARENDKPGVVQFWDPPYEGRAKGFYKFEEGTSPKEVCDVARGLKRAKVLITHYDSKEVREACAGLSMTTIPYQYVSRNRNHGKVHRVKELLLANYKL